MIQTNNRLIAEFMGLEEHKGSYYLSLYFIRDWVSDNYLEYHASWDWLMPVIEEIDHLKKIEDIGINYEPIDTIEKALSTRSIKNTYKAVVEFIKNQNN